MRAATLVALLFGLTGCNRQGGGKPSDDDLKALQGKWQVVSSEFEGTPVTDRRRNTIIVIEGDELYITDGFVQSKKEKFKLDPSTNPKSIDIDPGEKKAGKGIYSVEKEALKLCLSTEVGGKRP